MNHHREPERIRSKEASRLTGLAIRTIQLMAVQGKIPGAAKLGGSWTFSVAKLRQWIAAAERQVVVQANPPPLPSYYRVGKHTSERGRKSAETKALNRMVQARLGIQSEIERQYAELVYGKRRKSPKKP